MLTKAKLLRACYQPTVTKPSKKHSSDKPTLIISKKSGEYRVEIQPPEEKKGVRNSPVVYKILNPGIEEKVRKRDRAQSRLNKKAIKEHVKDSFDPKGCEKICGQTYDQFIKSLPFCANNPHCFSEESVKEEESCSCSLESISSSSSLDLDWEIHFTPPLFK